MTLPLTLQEPLTLTEALHLSAPLVGNAPEYSLDRLLLGSLLCVTSRRTLNWTATLEALMTGRGAMTILTNSARTDVQITTRTFESLPSNDANIITIRVADHLRRALNDSDWTTPDVPDLQSVRSWGDAAILAGNLIPHAVNTAEPDYGALSRHLLTTVLYGLRRTDHTTLDGAYRLSLLGPQGVTEFITTHPDFEVRDHAALPLSLDGKTLALITATITIALAPLCQPRPHLTDTRPADNQRAS